MLPQEKELKKTKSNTLIFIEIRVVNIKKIKKNRVHFKNRLQNFFIIGFKFSNFISKQISAKKLLFKRLLS